MKSIRLPVSIAVDVCIHHDAIIVVRHSGSDVVVEGFDFNLDELGEVLTIRGIAGNAAPRIHSWAGVLWLAYRDSFDRGYLIRMDSGEAVQLSPMFNAMSPFGFGRDSVAWMGDPRIAFVIGLGESVHYNNPHTFADSMATGLSHVQNGRPVTYDEMRTVRPYAVGFHQSGDFLMGEDFANRGLRGEVIGRSGRFVLWTDTNMQGPRLAAFNGQAALVSWASGGQHARLAIISPEDLTTEPEPVPPEPEPIPEPEPEPSMELPPNVRQLLLQFAATFPLPQTPGGGEEHENRCRDWCLKFAQQVRFSTNDNSWGVKKASGPQSKDTIARKLIDERIICWDLMSGAGTGRPTLNANPPFHDISNQTFIPVDAVNHLGVTPPPLPPIPPLPPPPSGNQLDRIESKLDRLLSVYRV